MVRLLILLPIGILVISTASIFIKLCDAPALIIAAYRVGIASLKYTSVASSVVLVTTHPIFVGIGGWLFLRERVSLNLVFGIALSVLGSGLIGYGDMSCPRKPFGEMDWLSSEPLPPRGTFWWEG